MYTVYVEQGPITVDGITYSPPAGLMNVHSEYTNADDAWFALNALIHAHVSCELRHDGTTLDRFTAVGTR